VAENFQVKKRNENMLNNDFKNGYNRKRYVKRYKAMLQLSKSIHNYFETYGFTADEKKKIADNPSQYAWKDFNYDNSPDGFKFLSQDDQGAAARYGARLFESLHGIRDRVKNIDPQPSVISKTRQATEIYAASALQVTFPAMHWQVSSSLGAEISAEKTKSWSKRDVTVTLPLSWVKRVHDKGISSIRAGDGMRFILDASERHIDRLSNDNIQAFYTTSLSINKTQPIIEKSWVMSYQTSDEPIVSVQKSFSRCESLLRRRIKDTVIKELMN